MRTAIAYTGIVLGLVTVCIGLDVLVAREFRPAHDAVVWSHRIAVLGSGWTIAGIGIACLTFAGLHRRKARAWRECGRAILISGAGTGLIVNVIKILVGRARPYVINDWTDVLMFHPLTIYGRWQSFPSGHTAAAWATAAVLAKVCSPALRVPIYGTAVAVGVARIIEKNHHPSDVIAGAIIGTVIGRWVLTHIQRSTSLSALFVRLRPWAIGTLLLATVVIGGAILRETASDRWWMFRHLLADGPTHSQTASPARSTPDPPPGWDIHAPVVKQLTAPVVFASNVRGSFDIYMLTRDGVMLLIGSPANDTYPAPSPDGRWIAFQRQKGRQYDLYLYDRVTHTIRPLMTTPMSEENPAWFPDSQRIAFDSDQAARRQLFVVDIFTGQVTQLTRGMFSRNILPDVSPDGRTIALTSSALFGWSIGLLDVAQGDLRIVLKGASCRPDWAPDGQRIALTTTRFDGKGDIAILDVRTGRLENLTPDRPHMYDYDPRWSPDGRWIVYQSSADKRTGNWRIMVLDTVRRRSYRLLDSAGQDVYPAWLPEPP